MARLSIPIIVVAALTALLPAAPASAITYEKLAYLTFTGPVQVPGVVLKAGTYQFRLTNPDTSRNVLQVRSTDGSAVIAMFHTIPDIRTKVTYREPVLTFIETPAGVPPAARTLFYPFESIGYEFVYPKGGPLMTADEAPQPEITVTTTPLEVPERFAAEPVGEPAFVAEPPVAEEPVAEPVPLPAELPRTASPLPFVAVGGLTLLFAGLGLGLLRRRAG